MIQTQRTAVSFRASFRASFRVRFRVIFRAILWGVFLWGSLLLPSAPVEVQAFAEARSLPTNLEIRMPLGASEPEFPDQLTRAFKAAGYEGWILREAAEKVERVDVPGRIFFRSGSLKKILVFSNHEPSIALASGVPYLVQEGYIVRYLNRGLPLTAYFYHFSLQDLLALSRRKTNAGHGILQWLAPFAQAQSQAGDSSQRICSADGDPLAAHEHEEAREVADEIRECGRGVASGIWNSTLGLVPVVVQQGYQALVQPQIAYIRAAQQGQQLAQTAKGMANAIKSVPDGLEQWKALPRDVKCEVYSSLATTGALSFVASGVATPAFLTRFSAIVSRLATTGKSTRLSAFAREFEKATAPAQRTMASLQRGPAGAALKAAVESRDRALLELNRASRAYASALKTHLILPTREAIERTLNDALADLHAATRGANPRVAQVGFAIDQVDEMGDVLQRLLGSLEYLKAYSNLAEDLKRQVGAMAERLGQIRTRYVLGQNARTDLLVTVAKDFEGLQPELIRLTEAVMGAPSAAKAGPGVKVATVGQNKRAWAALQEAENAVKEAQNELSRANTKLGDAVQAVETGNWAEALVPAQAKGTSSVESAKKREGGARNASRDLAAARVAGYVGLSLCATAQRASESRPEDFPGVNRKGVK